MALGLEDVSTEGVRFDPVFKTRQPVSVWKQETIAGDLFSSALSGPPTGVSVRDGRRPPRIPTVLRRDPTSSSLRGLCAGETSPSVGVSIR